MDRDRIVKQIATTLSAVLNQDLAEISEHTRLSEDLALDSMTVLQLLLQLEEELGIEIDMEELTPETLETVGALADHVAAAIAAREAG